MMASNAENLAAFVGAQAQIGATFTPSVPMDNSAPVTTVAITSPL